MLKLILLLITFTITQCFCQPRELLNSSEIKLALKKLNTLGTVLYIAAHPDDENTAFLTYFNYGKNIRTGYLSLTRGDGGQNLIGDEQGDLLGVIRTQELLQARSIDGAEQFFTRAIDFGYSKTPDETLSKWGKEEILSDVVWVIRNFKPDVIVTRFPPSEIGTHGHHIASAVLAVEAFNLANDPNAFPEQLQYADLWQPKRIFWNAWTPALNSMGISSDTLIKINFGDYNQLLGRSYTEISAESRTMHKSQGFGASGRRENYFNYFLQLAGEPASNDLFDGIDISWNRVSGSEKVASLLYQAENQFDFENPSKILPLLIQAYQEFEKIQNKFWTDVKRKELLNVIQSCAGIWFEAVTDENLISPGDTMTVTAGFVNRSTVQMTLRSVCVDYQLTDSTLNSSLKEGEMLSVDRKILIPENGEYSQPYWLKEQHQSDIYTVNEQKLIGQPKTDYPLYALFSIESNGNELEFRTPVFYRENDPVKGEVYKRVEIVPEAVVNFEKDLYLFKNGVVKEIILFVRNTKEDISGKIKLISDNSWNISPSFYDFNFDKKGEEREFKFNVKPNGNSSSKLKTVLEIDDKKLLNSLVTIDYPHIQTQTVLPEATAKVLKLDLNEKSVKKIAYIVGSGDKIPNLLMDVGFSVDVFSDEPLTVDVLKNYDVVITGIRAYNTNERLAIDQQNLLKYVEDGGTLLVQYNTLNNLLINPSPYELNISRDRVTEENSPVRILHENHLVLNYPYHIDEKDFNNWIQERGLYFPDKWDERFTPLLEMNDSGESAKLGSLLIANYGKGKFIYTGLSFFRQLPSGVEGAYRLFINLISAGVNE